MDTIVCMVCYFYESNYGDLAYDHPEESILCAQIAIIAARYDCGSLWSHTDVVLDKILRGETIETFIKVADLIYKNTGTDKPGDKILRSTIIDWLAYEEWDLKFTLESEQLLQYLRTNAELAVDVLVQGTGVLKEEARSQPSFVCKTLPLHSHWVYALPKGNGFI